MPLKLACILPECSFQNYFSIQMHLAVKPCLLQAPLTYQSLQLHYIYFSITGVLFQLFQ